MHQSTSEPFTSTSDMLDGTHIRGFKSKEFDEEALSQTEQLARMERGDQKIIREAGNLVDRFMAAGLIADEDRMINFLKGEDGDIQYVDDFRLMYHDGLSRMRDAILQKPDSTDRRRALIWLERLEALNAEQIL